MLTLPAHIERIFAQNDKSWNAKICFGELSSDVVAELAKANGQMVMIHITLADAFTDKEKEAIEAAKIYVNHTDSHTFEPKKESFLVAYEKKMGRSGEACKAIGIYRRTYYNWRESDPEFAAAVDAIDVSAIWKEQLESAAQDLIKERHPSMVIFGLKAQAGWKEGEDKKHDEQIGEIKLTIVNQPKQ